MHKLTKLIVLLLCMFQMSLYANLRKEISDIETLYNRGDLDAMAGALLNLKPVNDEERAFVLFYTAMSDKSLATASVALKQLAQNFPGTIYGQRGILELVKAHVLSRNIDEAIKELRRISSNELTEKNYWQAVCSFEINDWQNAINHAENYLRLSSNPPLSEEAYYIIAESYLNLDKSHSAISTLNKLKTLQGYPTDRQQFHYLLGYAFHRNQKPKDATAQYREGYLLDKYSQLAYLIEDRLFELKNTYGNQVDISFLYPYVELSMTETSIVQNTEALPNGSSALPALDSPLKVASRPEGEYFIQAGRFSTEANAANLAGKIRALDVMAVYYESLHNNKASWVVICGPFGNQQDAIFAHSRLKENEIDCFISRN